MSSSNVISLNQPDAAQRERLLDMLLSELDGMVYRCRVDEHWTMEFVSNGCRQLTGYEPGDLMLNSRISYEEVTLPDDRARVRHEILSALEQCKPFNVEYRIRCADGTIRRVWERGTGLKDDCNNHQIIQGFVEDITQRHAHEQALTEAQNRYRSIFENAVEGIFQTTVDGHYIEVNPALAAIYGYDSPGALIHDLDDIGTRLYVEPARREQFVALMKTRQCIHQFESRVYRRDGTTIWISENAHAVHGADGELLYFEGTVVDITARKQYETRISYQATHDSLTGLPNREALRQKLDNLILDSAQSGARFALLFLDLDHFKNINDSIGHAGGDRLIQEVAKRLLHAVRDDDMVARIGGDEFIILLTTLHQPFRLKCIVDRILATVRQPFVIADREYPVSCSAGISQFPEDGRDVDTLLKHSDIAMYEAKSRGRDGYQLFSDELNKRVMETLDMEHALRESIHRADFALHFQAIVDTRNQQVIKAESLLRWQSPQYGQVSPARFIPIAERLGLIEQLGAWVLDNAGKQLRQWLDEGLPVVPLSVNISPLEFRQPGLIGNIRNTLERYSIPPSLLEIEITENCMIHDLGYFSTTLSALKSLGIRISMDDFGSGYSNLQTLKGRFFDTLKIDSSFITELEQDIDNSAIYRAVIAMADSLGLQVIAEGVETRNQHEFLRELGCDACQGFYFGQPAPPEYFRQILVHGLSEKTPA